MIKLNCCFSCSLTIHPSTRRVVVFLVLLLLIIFLPVDYYFLIILFSICSLLIVLIFQQTDYVMGANNKSQNHDMAKQLFNLTPT